MFPHGHIDLRVNNLEEAYSFYSRFLPGLGFVHEWTADDGEEAFSFQTEGAFPNVSWFGVIEEKEHQANSNRYAFAVGSIEEVERVAEIVRSAGGRNVEGPLRMPYTHCYFAAYFEDPCGNRLEVYYCEV